MKKLIFSENTYHSKALLAECRRIETQNISLDQLKVIIQGLYSLPIEWEFDHKFKVERARFVKTEKSTWNEYTVTDGREIGHIFESES